ncbi:MAG TPA: aspartate carbamoyltransferase regulatory subunit [Candidatus Syntrophoarchaeum butanivorans]|nr:MAG: aspartate carbamoyltransferase regulatory subunit [Candidatus Syntrophoarchaeum sp. WYZ-LMO15]HDM36176.1 aspartate carbamoyltransferase regulatory subunit [Candidatus Syntrophoarchaeum butanivorans]HEC57705.1 aspartate carbamoyltransferase regulatory subunit [Candidatus Syntrophoarchaeum butanivorans]
MSEKTTGDEQELRVRKIENGTVIDQITAGQALNVLKILGITGSTDAVISLVMNVPSKKMGLKDIVKIEDRELDPGEVDRIALIAPRAKINIIRAYDVVEKHSVYLPRVIQGILRCANPNCISNTNEPVRSKFVVEGSEDKPIFRCFYCEERFENAIEHLI